MKFSLRVLDIVGAKPPTEASRGPHHYAQPILLPRAKADAFFAALSKSGSRNGVRVALPVPAAEESDSYSVWQGVYTRNDDVSPGEYLLVVTAKAKMPVFQRLTLYERNGMPLAKPGWSNAGSAEANKQALSVELPIGSQGARSNESQRAMIVVRLHMPVEFVLVAGTSFWHKLPGPDLNDPDKNAPYDHTDYTRVSRSRRDQLFQRQQMLAGFRVTEFDLLGRRRRIWVKATTDWLLVAETHTDTLSFDYAGNRSLGQTNPDNINIVDLYAYLNSVGATNPGSVWSVEFFGHAFHKAPLLWNTNEGEDYKERLERDPKDHDPRPKDLEPAALKAYPMLSDAHLYKAVWRIWGCNAERKLIAAAVAAHAQLGHKLPEHSLFKYKKGNDWEEQLTLASLMWTIRETIRGGYAAAVVNGLGRTVGCYAAPPGFGASLGAGMFITRNRSIVEGTSQGTGPDELALSRVYALYRRFVSAGYVSAGIERVDGYFEIRWLLDEAKSWPERIWSPGRYAWKRRRGDKPASLTKFASGVTCQAPETLRPAVSLRTALVDQKRAGWLFVFTGAAIAECDSRGAPRLVSGRDDVGFYQQDDGSLFVMKRDSAKEWAVDTRPIARGSGSTSNLPVVNGVLAQAKELF